jgi:hypothetical protein
MEMQARAPGGTIRTTTCSNQLKVRLACTSPSMTGRALCSFTVSNTAGEALRRLLLLAHMEAAMRSDELQEQVDDSARVSKGLLLHQPLLFSRNKSRVTKAAFQGLTRRG